MRISKGPLWAIMALALALVLSIPISAGAVESADWSPWMSMRPIAENPPIMIVGTAREWTWPDVDGNYVVCNERLVDADGSGPGTAAGDWNIQLYNLNTGTKTAVTTAAGDQNMPRISGDWVVYTDAASTSNDIKAYKISTGATVQVTNRAGSQDSPDISGTRIVYRDDPAAEVRMYNLANGADTVVQAGADSPAISGNRVVFVHADDVKLKSLTTGLVTPVNADGAALAEAVPRIDGDHVVYMHQVAGLDYDIVGYTISTGLSKTLASGSSSSFYCDVDDGRAVWESYDGGAPFLMAYDFAKDKSVTIANLDPLHLTQPMISGNRVAFVQATSSFLVSNGEIHLGMLSAPTVSLSTPSLINYGAKPALSGRLVELENGLGGKPLDVLRSTDGGHTWSLVGTTTTKSDGSYSYAAAPIYSKAWYRVRYNGQTESVGFGTRLSRFSAMSGYPAVNPRASLGKPTGYPSTGKKTKTYTVYGSLKPRQAASASSAKVVVIKCYRKINGTYKLRKTVNAKVYDYDTYSRYRASVKLTSAGKWRLRAYFKGTGINAEQYSAYRYVKVK